MALAYKSQGVAHATSSLGVNLAPACPTTVDPGDILITHAWYRNITTDLSAPSDWTLLGGPFEIVASRQWVWGKVAVGDEDGATIALQTVPTSTLRIGQIYSFSGWEAGHITNLVGAVTFEEGATATIADVNVTTPVAGCIAVNLVAIEDDLPAPSFDPTNTGISGGTWVENVAETVSSLGSDGTIGIQTAELAAAGTIGGGTFVRGAADNWGIIGFYIQPNALQPLRRVYQQILSH